MAQEVACLSPDTPFLTVAEEGCMQINFEYKVAPVTGAAEGVGLSNAWTFAQPSRVKTPSSALPPGLVESGLAEFDHGSRRPQMSSIYEARAKP